MTQEIIGRMNLGDDINVTLSVRVRSNSSFHMGTVTTFDGTVTELRKKAVRLLVNSRYYIWLPLSALRENKSVFGSVTYYSYELKKWFRPDANQNSIMYGASTTEGNTIVY